MDEFEEMFKTKSQGPTIDLSMSKQKVSQKGPNRVTLLDSNRAKNLAITLRKVGKAPEEICRAIQLYVITNKKILRHCSFTVLLKLSRCLPSGLTYELCRWTLWSASCASSPRRTRLKSSDSLRRSGSHWRV